MRVVLAVLLLAVSGCGSGNAARDANDSAVDDPNVIEGEDIDRRALTRVEEMLRGQVAGVEVRQEGGGLVIRIRGAQSFQSNADPLFVIDGLPISPGPGGALVGINPNDIESIRVLKNVSETAIYGARGANGVILITTARPPAPEG